MSRAGSALFPGGWLRLLVLKRHSNMAYIEIRVVYLRARLSGKWSESEFTYSTGVGSTPLATLSLILRLVDRRMSGRSTESRPRFRYTGSVVYAILRTQYVNHKAIVSTSTTKSRWNK
jgi:hypothetical protein